MFERFTDRARRVIVLAQAEAMMLDHNYIGTEHLLLGLLHEGQGVAAQVLESLGIGLEAVREQVEDAAGRGQQAVPERTPFTAQAKKVLELARREAFQLGHHYIGTEHILLGLIREGDGTGARVLAGLGADLHQARQQVIWLLHDCQGNNRPASGGGGWQRPPGRRPRGHLPEILNRVESIGAQLSAIEEHPGIGPQTSLAEELHRLGEQIGQLRDLLTQQGTNRKKGAA
jgi:ATP-dependent Clp protease ATP-binding subunit ClpC